MQGQTMEEKKGERTGENISSRDICIFLYQPTLASLEKEREREIVKETQSKRRKASGVGHKVSMERS